MQISEKCCIRLHILLAETFSIGASQKGAEIQTVLQKLKRTYGRRPSSSGSHESVMSIDPILVI